MIRGGRVTVCAIVVLMLGGMTPSIWAQDDFATPVGATPVPVPAQPTPVVTPPAPGEIPQPICYGDACDGVDPDLSYCDLGENGVYRQGDPVVIKDELGHTLGTLQLVANHAGCGSVQWVLFVPEMPFTFALRVRQNRTGLATEWQPYPDRRERAWSTMLHSPVERVRGELAVPDENGGWKVIGFTDSF